MISDDQLKEFMQLCKASGSELSQEEALKSALSLINVVKLTYKPMSKDELELVNKRRGLV